MLSNYTVPELKAKAREKGLKGYSRLVKDDLIALIRGELTITPKSTSRGTPKRAKSTRSKGKRTVWNEDKGKMVSVKRSSKSVSKSRRKSRKRAIRSVWNEDKGKMVAVKRRRSSVKGKYSKWSDEKDRMVRSKRPVNRSRGTPKSSGSVRRGTPKSTPKRASRRTSRASSPRRVQGVPVRWQGTHLVFDESGRSRVHRRGKGVHTRLS
jgi:hypothetical protein